LANVPEVINLALEAKGHLPNCFIFVGGHSASFIAADIIVHAGQGIDCVVRGEGENIAPLLLDNISEGDLESLPGIVTANGVGPPPVLTPNLDDFRPARDLVRKRRRYFMGHFDPCASIEFSRGCPWNCSFCSGWTFYGRTYRKASAEAIVEDLARIREPNIFVVDDVAFIHPEHATAIADEIEKRKIRKRFYVETRCDVLVRNNEVFARWKRLGLEYMFLGVEAIDEEGLKNFRKRVDWTNNMQALEIARKLDIVTALNIIADPGWDENRFRVVREWAQNVPEIVNLTVNTPYPGTETWYTEPRKLTTHDYRLFDVQHAVLPTKLSLDRFYHELIATQAVLNRKHLGLNALRKAAFIVIKLLFKGQTNFFKMLWKFNQVYNVERQHADHFREVKYRLRPQPLRTHKPAAEDLYVHLPTNAPKN
jgi:magnesium-protoporphyrin IX monomethyl ester (oxidative) cyclase